MSMTTVLKKAPPAAATVAVAAAYSNSASAAASHNNKSSISSSRNLDENAKKCSNLIPEIDRKRKAILQEHGVYIEPLEPLGARVLGLDLLQEPPSIVRDYLELEMAHRGFLVFPRPGKGLEGTLTPDEQIQASCLFGGRDMHSTHGVHPATPDHNPHIFRLSNDPNQGITGVGPQWHNDGSFVPAVFSHVGYHMLHAPEKGGGTYFCHQGAAFDMLTPEEQERWSRLTSVNSNSGVLHPVVHKHPISKRKSVWLHLGMTGAVIEYLDDKDDINNNNSQDPPFRLLTYFEMKELFNRYNDLLNQGINDGYAANYQYETGDFVVIDNWAIGHKAAPEAHMSVEKQGLRIMHRTTVRSPRPFKPGFGLEQETDIYDNQKPFNQDGVWIGGGIGFRWDESIKMQN